MGWVQRRLFFSSPSWEFPKHSEDVKIAAGTDKLLYVLLGSSLFLMEQSIQMTPGRAMSFVLGCASFYRRCLRWTLR